MNIYSGPSCPPKSHLGLGVLGLILSMLFSPGAYAELKSSAVSSLDNQGSMLNTLGGSQASGAMGSLQTQIPLQLPEWRGLWPQLDLSYSSSSGMGQAGYGWVLNIPSIYREARRHGVPDDQVMLMSSMDGELVPLQEAVYQGFGDKTFRAQLDSSQNLYIQHQADGGESYFEMRTGSGMSYIFGQSSAARESDSRIETQWHLERIVDAYQNAVIFQYTKTHSLSQLQRLLFVNALGRAEESVSYVTDLAYEETPKLWVSYDEGIEKGLSHRIKSMTAYWLPDLMQLSDLNSDGTVDISLNRMYRYQLYYETSGPSSSSLLRRVEYSGLTDEDRMPGREFSYSSDLYEGDGWQVQSIDSHGLSNFKNIRWLDVNLDGMPDALSRVTSGNTLEWVIQYNLGNGQFSAREKSDAQGFDLGTDAQLVDLNRDFVADVVQWLPTQSRSRIFPSKSQTGIWSSTGQLLDGLNTTTSSQFVDWVDVNNDRAVDFVRYSQSSKGLRIFVYKNQTQDGEPSFTRGRMVKIPAGAIRQSPSEIDWQDFNGDGLEDLYVFEPGNSSGNTKLKVFYNRGVLSNSSVPLLENSNTFYFYRGEARQNLNDVEHLSAADINGDGLTDVIYAKAGTVRLFYNQLDRFEEQFIPNTPEVRAAVKDLLRLELGDMNGNGTTDIFILTRSGKIVLLDPYGEQEAQAPRLLVKESTDLGAETRYSYRTHLKRSQDQMYRKKRFPTTTQVLAGIETWAPSSTWDQGYQLQKTSKETFDYLDPVYSFDRQEYHGFSQVIREIWHDEEGREKTRSHSTYYTDEFGGLISGTLKSQETYHLDQSQGSSSRTILSSLIQTAEVKQILPESPVSIVEITKQQREVHEDDGSRSYLTRSRLVYDSTWGLLEKSESISYDESENPYLMSVREYDAEPNDAWIQGQLVSQALLHPDRLASEPLSFATWEYDDNGRLSSQEILRDDVMQPQDSFRYDEFGNQTHRTDPSGQVYRRFYEDPGSFTVTSQSTQVGTVTLKSSQSIDYHKQVVTGSTDYNGNQSRMEFDGLGRPIAIYRPKSDEPVQTTEYVFGGPKSMSYAVIRQLGVAKEIRTFYDGHMRAVAGVTPVESGYVLSGYRVFDLRGLVTSVSGREAWNNQAPVESFRPDPNIAVYTTYDSRGRSVRLDQPSPDQNLERFVSSEMIYGIDSLRSINALSDQTEVTWDYFGRITTSRLINQEQAGADRIVEAQHDRQGRIVRLHLRGDEPRIYTWNEVGELRSVLSAQGRRDMDYGVRGELATSRIFDSKGAELGLHLYDYDELLRPLSHRERFPGGENLRYEFTYDRLGQSSDQNANRLGRLTQMTLEDGSTYTMSYGNYGETTTSELVLSNGKVITNSKTVDVLGRIQAITYPTGESVPYRYSTETGALQSMPGFVRNLSWDTLGRPANLQLGEGIEHQFSYLKDMGLVDGHSLVLKGQKFDRSYQYDDIRRLSTIVGETPWYKSFRKSYQFDSLGQLRNADYRFVPRGDSETPITKNFSYDFDLSGHPSQWLEDSVERFYESINSSDIAKRLTTVLSGDKRYDFDAAGRVVLFTDQNGQQQSLSWSSDNQLRSRSIAGGKKAEYIYNPDQTRFAEMITDQDNKLIEHKIFVSNLVHYDVLNDRFELYYSFGGKRIAKKDAETGETLFFLRNHIGSIQAEIAANGDVKRWHEYSPYGDKLDIAGAEDPGKFGFAGAMYDADFGTQQMQFRHFDSGLGSFLSPDPLLTLSPGTCLSRPNECGLYGYAGGDPVNFLDPSGLVRGDKPEKKSVKPKKKGKGKKKGKPTRSSARQRKARSGIPVNTQSGISAFFVKLKNTITGFRSSASSNSAQFAKNLIATSTADASGIQNGSLTGSNLATYQDRIEKTNKDNDKQLYSREKFTTDEGVQRIRPILAMFKVQINKGNRENPNRDAIVGIQADDDASHMVTNSLTINQERAREVDNVIAEDFVANQGLHRALEQRAEELDGDTNTNAVYVERQAEYEGSNNTQRPDFVTTRLFTVRGDADGSESINVETAIRHDNKSGEKRPR